MRVHGKIKSPWPRIMFVGIIAIVCLVPVPSTAEELTTSEQAIERALEFAGFEQMPFFNPDSAAISAVRTAIVDSTTPFISDSISGENRWIVTFDSLYLSFDSAWSEQSETNQIRKSFNFVLEPGTGRLLKIYTDYNEDDPSVPAEWPAKQMERHKRRNNVVYAGLVDTVPPVSFHEALEKAIFIQPLSAKQILAWLVMYSEVGEEPSPHWVILGRGVPPIGLPSSPDPFTNQPTERLSGNRFECIIDAISGKGIGCGESCIYLRND